MNRKVENKIVIVIAILILGIVGALGYVFYPKQKDVTVNVLQFSKPVKIDPDVALAGKNYTEKTNESERTVTRTYFTQNIEYRAADGTYKPIDTDIVRTSGEYQYENTKNVFASYFKKDGNAEDAIKYQIGERSIAYTFVGANKTNAVVKDNTITYPNIYDGLDAKYTVTESSLLEELVAEKPVEVDRITVKAKLSGVHNEMQKDGSIKFFDDKSNGLAFIIPAPVMYEKEHPDSANFNLHYEVEEKGAGEFLLSKVINPEGKTWLQKASYPVAIDQTTVTISATPTVSFVEGYSSNYLTARATGSAVAAGGRFGQERIIGPSYYVYRTFLRFNTSTLPDNAVIASADLLLFGSDDNSIVRDFSISVVQGNQLAQPPTTADFTRYGATVFSSLSTSAYIVGSDNTLVLDANGRAIISLTGNTQYALLSSLDLAASQPPSNGREDVLISNPRLRVTYNLPPSAPTTVLLYAPTYTDRLTVDFLTVSGATYYRVEHSTTGLAGSYSYVCNPTPPNGPTTNCTLGAGTYDCTIAGACSYTHTGLGADTSHYYRVAACNAVGCSAYTNATAPGCTPTDHCNTLAYASTAGPALAAESWAYLNVTNLNVNALNPAWTTYRVRVDKWTGATYDSNYFLAGPCGAGGEYLYSKSFPPLTHVDQTTASWGSFIISGEEGCAQPFPDMRLRVSTYAINGTGNFNPTPPTLPASTERYTRARNVRTPIYINKTNTTLTMRINTTPTSQTTYTNQSWTNYSLRLTAGLSPYVNPSNGTLSGTEAFAVYAGPTTPNWGGDAGRQVVDLSPNACYQFQNRSRNGDGLFGELTNQDGWSTATASICTLPNVPSVSNIVCGYSTSRGYYCDLTINENGNPDGSGGSNSTQYQIERSTNNGGSWTPLCAPSITRTDQERFVQRENGIIPAASAATKVLAQACSTWWTHSNFDPGNIVEDDPITCTDQPVQYRIKARNVNDEESDYSTVVQDILPPCAPTNMRHADNTPLKSITWTWDAPISSQPITAYNIYDQNGLLGQPSPLTATTFTKSNYASNNTQYQARARAISAKGEGAGSAFASAYTAIEPPSGVTITLPGQGVTGSLLVRADGPFTNAWADQSGVQFRETTGNPGGGGVDTGFPDFVKSQDVTDTGLSINRQYCYQARARNGDGIDTAPGDYTGWRPGAAVCKYTRAQQPQTLSVTSRDNPTNSANDTTMNLTWTDSNPAGTKYQLQRADDINFTVNLTTLVDWVAVKTYADSGLTENKQYWYRVKARNEENQETLWTTIQPYAAIQRPTGVGFGDVTANTIEVIAQCDPASPECPATGGFSNVTNFSQGGSAIFFDETTGNTGGGGAEVEWVLHADTVTDTGLWQNTKYTYKAQARNADSIYLNQYSPSSSMYTLANVPQRPELSRVDESTMRVKIRENNNPAETQFAIRAEYTIDVGGVPTTYGKCVDWTGVGTGVLNGDCPAAGNISPPDNDWWHKKSGDWGDNGVQVQGLDPNITYVFSVKARNGEDSDIDVNGCTSGLNCVETTWGPGATLFLVARNIVGWAWSPHIGWISSNCLNLFNEETDPKLEFGYSCFQAKNWGLNTNFDQDREINPVTGYGWSSNVGWASANIKVCSDDTQLACAIDNDCPAAGGIYTGDAFTNLAFAVVRDASSIYVAGNDETPDWRIEKRNLSNGALVPTFGTGGADGDGVVTGASASRYISDVAIDSSYMYVAGDDSAGDWRIEKRNLSDGALVPTFGTGGVITGDSASDFARGIAIDATSLYVTGTMNGANDWRIEKRNLSDGALVPTFGTNGVVSGASASGSAGQIALDSTSMYVVGYDLTNDWRIEKRRLTDGALCTAANCGTEFGTGGVITSAPESFLARGIAIDATSMYVVGLDGTNDWRIEKRNLSDGALVPTFGTGGADGDGVITGAAETSSARDVVIDSTSMYVVGNTNGNDWRIEKRLLTAGDLAGICNESAGTPSSGSTYGYCFNTDATPKRYGTCKLTTSQPCTEADQTAVCTQEGDYCVYNTCKTGTTCPASGTCRLSSTINFNNVTQEVEGQLRVLSMKDYGTTRGFSDWGWIKLAGTYGGPGADKDTLGLWHFTENGTDPKTGDGFDVYDSSFNRRSGTLGATGETAGADDPAPAAGKYGSAYTFNRTNSQFIEIPNFPDVGDFTLEAWIKPSTLDDGGIISKSNWGGAATRGYYLRLWAGELRFDIGDGSAEDYVGSGPITAGTWYYVVATKDASGIKIYLNGILKQQKPFTTFANSSSPLHVGHTELNNVYFNGTIDEVRISGRALSAPEIENEFNNEGPYHLTSTDVNSRDFLGDPNIDPAKVILYSMFGWAWSGASSPGLGWLSFVPAGALLGIPYLQGLQGDIFARQNIELAPPPRASGEFNATFLLISGGEITGVPGFYPSSFTGPPTTEFQGGLQPLIQGYPIAINQDILKEIDVDGLVAPVANGKDKYGYEVVDSASLDVDAILSANNPLHSKVYSFKTANPNDTFTIDQPLTILNGEAGPPAGSGAGLIVVNGNLSIKANVQYESIGVSDPVRLASVAWIVNGKIDIDPAVSKLASVFVARGSTSETGLISTSVSLNGDQGELTKNLSSTDDDVTAWGTTAGDCVTSGDCAKAGDLLFGWQESIIPNRPNRAFLRFAMDLSPNSELIKAELLVKPNGQGHPNGTISGRAGLIDSTSPNFGSNPYGLPIMKEVYFGVSPTDDWSATAPVWPIDVTRLVQAYVEDIGLGYDGVNDIIGFALRRDTNETIDPNEDQYRGFQGFGAAQPAQLKVTYKTQLEVSGMLLAQSYNFGREYKRENKPAEKVTYDGRILANSPPGLQDFTKALPIYERQAP